MIGKIKCFFGFHSWQHKMYDDGEGEFVWFSICRRPGCCAAWQG